ncbi:hypothetical protein Pcinc_002245 [Petrolisthes cinctipes]|uniref:Uncharacterized protein n=1 Tax=Petrolisthes cinctipes TaxID=88211 RepID=A0AAE1L5J2_PETCI|nr:hypothetical protein Pcinc_002245 [Petrolisthes cinctipes]
MSVCPVPGAEPPKELAATITHTPSSVTSYCTSAAKTTMTLAEYKEAMDNHHKVIQTNSATLTQLTENLKSIRESKAPLTEVKNTLQEEINNSNRAINTLSEEVTHLKQKLRYHNVRQVHDNIDRLEYQLRNNNYKPREEQKILDEISMLKRSIRTLKEYEAKQTENRKYRNERSRLIDERNENFTRIRKLYREEDNIKKDIATIREEIYKNKKCIEQLRLLRPKLEQEWAMQQKMLHAARLKRYEEKQRERQEQRREREAERRKLWEEYEASREPYEEEKNLCRVLIAYLQSSCTGSHTPCTPASSTSSLSQLSASSTPAVTPASTPSSPATSILTHTFSSMSPVTPTASLSLQTTVSPPTESIPSETSVQSTSGDSPSRNQNKNLNSTLMQPPLASGSYYTKPKADDEGFLKVTKRGKAKARREQRLSRRVKDLPHTPDVLAKFNKLTVQPPRNTDEVPGSIIALQDCLQRYCTLSVSEAECLKCPAAGSNDKKNKVCEKSSVRPKSLQVKENCVTPSDTVLALTSYSAVTTASVACTTGDSISVSSESCSLPGATAVLPGVLWSEESSSTEVTTTEGSRFSTHVTYNSIHPSVNGTVAHGTDSIVKNSILVPDIKPDINKMCTDILAQGNSDSYFSVPMSYANNCVEPNDNHSNNNICINNNTVFTYAAVTAKVSSSSVEISD